MTRNGNVWQGKCPFHNDDTPSFTVWENGTWKCFGCGVGGDLINFRALFEHLTCSEVVGKFCSELNLETTKDDSYLYHSDPLIDSIRKAELKKEEIELPSLDPNLFKEYQQNRATLLRQEQWQNETLNEFEIGFCLNPLDELYGRITIPIYDKHGNLVTIAGKRIDGIKSRKYKFLYNIDKSYLLYNLHKAAPYIYEKKELIIVEGFKDVWRAWETGLKNVVATMGGIPSDSQLDLLLKYGKYNLVIALDNDEAGQKGAVKVVNALSTFCKIRKIDFSGHKDFGECTQEEVIEYYKGATIC